MKKLNHCVYNLNYHVIFVTKYRRKILSNDTLTIIEDTFKRLVEKHNSTIKEFNGEEDHVHFILESPPNEELSSLIGILKSQSSKVLGQELLKGQKIWSTSYFISSIGGVTLDIVMKYIDGQERPM